MSRYLEGFVLCFIGVLMLSWGDDGGPGAGLSTAVGIASVCGGVYSGFKAWVTRYD